MTGASPAAAPPATGSRVLGLVGASWRPARPRMLVEAAAARLAAAHGIGTEVADLLDAGPGLGAFQRRDMDARAEALIAKVETAEALIIGCPVFQGGMPGLLKHLFDQAPEGALKGRPVLITACGGGLRHALVVEHQIRPLFGYFEALTCPTAVYAGTAELSDGAPAPALAERIEAAAAQLAALMAPRRTTGRRAA
ncbi:NAD(P)H-dependent oxidoreductase [Rhodovulum sp. DZ06]|uniref:NAD(P)H-dependent oxidoreductase n=1 Tax=Rhodovulum sp. DZ06 TaxID=3425126 RepID=UPI003D3367EE